MALPLSRRGPVNNLVVILHLDDREHLLHCHEEVHLPAVAVLGLLDDPLALAEGEDQVALSRDAGLGRATLPKPEALEDGELEGDPVVLDAGVPLQEEKKVPAILVRRDGLVRVKEGQQHRLQLREHVRRVIAQVR